MVEIKVVSDAHSPCRHPPCQLGGTVWLRTRSQGDLDVCCGVLCDVHRWRKQARRVKLYHSPFCVVQHMRHVMGVLELKQWCCLPVQCVCGRAVQLFIIIATMYCNFLYANLDSF